MLFRSVQPKLLRAIENKSGARMGSHALRAYDVRIISATNAPLLDDPRRFRPELLNRLNVLSLRMPALRSHPEDIPLLAKRFLEELSPSKTLDEGAVKLLCSGNWPGNVRELRNAVQRASVLSAERMVIKAEDLESRCCSSWGLGQRSLLN